MEENPLIEIPLYSPKRNYFNLGQYALDICLNPSLFIGLLAKNIRGKYVHSSITYNKAMLAFIKYLMPAAEILQSSK